MPLLSQEQVLERLKRDASNSSHPVWPLAGLTYYESSNHLIFGFKMFKRLGDVCLVALEPLVAGGSPLSRQDFDLAWQEFCRDVKPGASMFVSVYDEFVPLLESAGFSAVKVGREPWVDLADCIPTGNAGKGVRSARNQAIQAGLQVEEWTWEAIQSDDEKKNTLQKILREWKSTRLITLEGFLNATDPLAELPGRRFFVLRSQHRVEAYLVATPVAARNGYFLEDMVMRNFAPRGAGELLTLEAMLALKDSGGEVASLGVVSMTEVDVTHSPKLPPLIKFLMVTVPGYARMAYNFDGLETYRKRFKPRLWRGIFVAVNPGLLPPAVAWLRSLFALLVAFRPRLVLNFEWFKTRVLWPLRKYPVTLTTVFISTVLFATLNHFGELPEKYLHLFGFSAAAPISQWWYRSMISDILYFNRAHFLSCLIPLGILLGWAERSHSRRFVATVLIWSYLVDDTINYMLLIRPFQYFQPSLFKDLVVYKDVGGSLTLMTFAGLQVCQFRFLREPIFAILMLASILGFAFASAKLQWLVLNLNHVVFLVIGFLIGKAHFEYRRYKNQRASKGKPPVSKSVRLVVGSKELPKDRRRTVTES
jgi:hypothetical protein